MRMSHEVDNKACVFHVLKGVGPLGYPLAGEAVCY